MMDKLQGGSDWNSLPKLRERCKVLSEIWGFTVFVVSHTNGHCEFVRGYPRPARINDRLTNNFKVENVRAIVEWEIAKAEGRLRIAA
jgi:hypothetical protein